jgi:SAM-dependent methyltransferase
MAPGPSPAESRVAAPEEVAAAYDAIAPGYDALVVEDRWMREVLWAHYARLVRVGERVLELGCGTGLDTLSLARRGVEVSAVDVSPGMIARLTEKARQEGLSDLLELRVGDLAELDGYASESFDAVISSFAVLNTVEDLEGLAAAAARVLRPGGRMVLHLLAPGGLWERQKQVVTICGRPVRHRLLSAGEAGRRFAGPFRPHRVYGLGFLWPRAVGRWIPLPVARLLGHLEARLGTAAPFLDWGRFFVLDLEKAP